MELKYKHEILSEFAKLHFAPRDNQLEIINTILTKFLDENYKNVILCAGTGSGKSVMGLVVSRVLDNIASSNNDELKTHSKIIMNTNVLIDQYIRSFNHLPESEFFYRKGASNYNCDYMESVLPKPWLEPVTAELCVHDDNKCKLKHLCKYYSVFEKQRNTKCLVTNYSYYMMTNILSDKDQGGLINIFDEAHTMNDVFASFCSFVLTNKTANKLKELYEKVHNYFPNYFNDNKSKANNLSGVFDAISKSLEVISIQDEFDLSKIPIPERQNVMIKRQKENVKYFRHILETITEPIKLFSNITNKINSEEYKISIFPWGDTKEDRTLYQKKHKLTDEQMRKLEKEYSDKYQTIQSSRKKCQSLLNQIDLIKDDDELLFENIVDGENRGISASPVFIKKYWSRLDKAEYNLLMSATITKEYVESTIALNGKTAYIYVPSVFPKENKMIVDYKSFPLNYANMQKPEVINHLLQSCADIVSMNNDVNGIILTTTFDLTRKIAEKLRKKSEVKVYEHLQGTKVSDIINEFKLCKTPCVLISPSLWEGISFDDDMSRYQIVCKTPYGSLGSKRNKYIQYKLPEIYSQQTLLTLIQGFGRSVRNANDFCFTFCLDKTTFQILNKPSNVWKNDFTYGTIN